MRAKSLSLFLQVLALVALAGVLAPRVAKAQQNEGGKFTLPTQVHWGTAVLPAGDYSFVVDILRPSPRLYVWRKSAPTAGYVFVAQSRDTISVSSEGDQFVLEQREGEVFVTEFRMGVYGLALHFAAPKNKK